MSSKATSDDGKEYAVFEVHGKKLSYGKTSLLWLGQDNRFRMAVVMVVAHPWFDRFILFLILLNSIVLAMTDWSVIDEDPSSSTVGEPSADGSWQNELLYTSEPVFTAFFTVEFVLKVIAQGFCVGHGSYLRNAWNVLDFVVVITALLSSVPGVPKMTAIRVFRVLRPLRSVSALPGLQKLVLGMLKSVPQLVSVVILLMFIFTVFGIFGIQIFAGKQHARCRLTPYPVVNSYEVGMNYTDFRCLDVSNFDVEDDEPTWTHSSSPWHTPRECWWPVDWDDDRLCTLSGDGKHECDHDPAYMDQSDWRWCGSNYDALGNRRFAGGVIEGKEWGSHELTMNATYVEDLNWGFTTFDNIFVAVMTIFQAITLEAWSDVLYQVKDCSVPILADIFYIVLILWGSFFTLNLLLAVLEANFNNYKEDDTEVQTLTAGEQDAPTEGKISEDERPYWEDGSEEKKEDGHASSSEDGRLRERREKPKQYSRWRLTLRRLVNGPKFQQVITVMIVLNTIVLSIDHHPMNDELMHYLEVLNFGFTICFAVEMILKLVALGPREYAKDRLNLFDGVIVLSSLVELTLSPPSFLGGSSDESSGGLSALRTFRVLRVFKLARSWKSMRELLTTLSKTIIDVGNFGLLLVLFMYIYALVGLQFFANRFHFDDQGDAVGIGEEGYYTADVPRSNFDTLLQAFTTIFVILSGDSWTSVMYDARRATGAVSIIYFVTLIVLGMMIIMTLFLAILLTNFGDDDDDDGDVRDAETSDKEDEKEQRQNSEQSLPALETSKSTPSDGPRSRDSNSSPPPGIESNGRHPNGKPDGNDDVPHAHLGGKSDNADGGAGKEGIVARVRELCKQAGPSFLQYCVESIRNVKVPEDLNPGRSLLVFGPKNPVRRGCAALVATPGFDRFILALIGISSLSLALDSPLLDPDSTLALVLGHLETVITWLFVLEMALKVFAHGFVFMSGAYLRNGWNVLDFVVVLVSVFQLFTDSSGSLQGLKSLRSLRALRPLRIINRAPGLKLVLNALFSAIPDVLNVAAVCFMFFLIFAILGVTYFKGILMSCQGDDFDALPDAVTSFIGEPVAWSDMSAVQQEWFGPFSNVSETLAAESASDCETINSGWPESAACCSAWPLSPTEAPTSFEVCECLGLVWDETIPQQFDNVGLALLTFFEMSTISGWSSVTYAAVDATEVDMQPIRDKHLARVWFFMLFILFGSYLVMNLFVGVIIENFKKMKSKAEGDGVMMTSEQQSWMKTQLIMARLRPLKRVSAPGNVVGDWCFRLTRRKWFDLTIMTCIVLNTVVMAMQYFGQGDTYTIFLEGANYAFYTVFAFEAFIKIFALRKKYFTDPWNRFDFFIVVGSTLGLVMLWTTGSSYGSIAMIVRIFRIGRILRLIRGLESMAQLFHTLLLTLPSLGNVGALLFLMFFIYAAMGMQLFAKVSFEGAVNEQANFQSFWGSMVLLLRFSTGDNWNGFMYDMAAERDGCENDPKYDPDVCGFTDRPNCIPLDGCGNSAIYPYMITFTLTIAYVFMNLFIGVILDGFDEASHDEHEVIRQEDFARFARNWEEFDPRATCFISVHDLPKFLQTLFSPWGFGEEHQATERELRNKIERLNLRVTAENTVHFQDVLLALSKEVHRAEAEKKGVRVELSQSYKLKNSNSRKGSAGGAGYIVNPFSKRNVTLEQILAAEYIQRAYRRKREWERRRRERAHAWAPYSGQLRVMEAIVADPRDRKPSGLSRLHDRRIAPDLASRSSDPAPSAFLPISDGVVDTTPPIQSSSSEGQVVFSPILTGSDSFEDGDEQDSRGGRAHSAISRSQARSAEPTTREAEARAARAEGRR